MYSLYSFFFLCFLPSLLAQRRETVTNASQINFGQFFNHFAHLQHFQGLQQQLAAATNHHQQKLQQQQQQVVATSATSSSSSSNSAAHSQNAAGDNQRDGLQQSDESSSRSTSILYKATISPPGRYAIIAWDGFLLNAATGGAAAADDVVAECQQKIIFKPTAKGNDDQLLSFTSDAFDSQHPGTCGAQLSKCFRHFYMTHSDPGGQFVLRHNLFAAAAANGCSQSDDSSNDNWWTICNPVAQLTKWWRLNGGGGTTKRQRRVPQSSSPMGVDEDNPRRIVHLQVLPVDYRMKPIPSFSDANLAAQITRQYKAQDLCTGNDAVVDDDKDNGSNNPGGHPPIDYHEANNRAKIVTEIVGNWLSATQFGAENCFFLVSYLRYFVSEFETCAKNGDGQQQRSTAVVALMAKYDKIAVPLLAYGAALADTFFHKMHRLTPLLLVDTNFVVQMFGMVNRMCTVLASSVSHIGTLFQNWQTVCHKFNAGYAQFAKRRNKFMFTLFDQCLFEQKLCYVDQNAIYYVEHLMFQVEAIVADRQSTCAQMNGHDQRFLAQIGQLLSVAMANKDEHKLSFFDANGIILSRLNPLFRRLCQNWHTFVDKSNNENSNRNKSRRDKFNAWTALCSKKNLFMPIQLSTIANTN